VVVSQTSFNFGHFIVNERSWKLVCLLAECCASPRIEIGECCNIFLKLSQCYFVLYVSKLYNLFIYNYLQLIHIYNLFINCVKYCQTKSGATINPYLGVCYSKWTWIFYNFFNYFVGIKCTYFKISITSLSSLHHQLISF